MASAKGLSHPQFVRGFEHRAAFAADDRAAVSADEGVSDFLCAAGAVEWLRCRFWGHQE